MNDIDRVIAWLRLHGSSGRFATDLLSSDFLAQAYILESAAERRAELEAEVWRAQVEHAAAAIYAAQGRELSWQYASPYHREEATKLACVALLAAQEATN